jgi:hypothetical protein
MTSVEVTDDFIDALDKLRKSIEESRKTLDNCIIGPLSQAMAAQALETVTNAVTAARKRSSIAADIHDGTQDVQASLAGLIEQIKPKK